MPFNGHSVFKRGPYLACFLSIRFACRGDWVGNLQTSLATVVTVITQVKEWRSHSGERDGIRTLCTHFRTYAVYYLYVEFECTRFLSRILCFYLFLFCDSKKFQVIVLFQWLLTISLKLKNQRYFAQTSYRHAL